MEFETELIKIPLLIKITLEKVFYIENSELINDKSLSNPFYTQITPTLGICIPKQLLITHE